jgi:Uma2 family endonuclease
MQWLEVISDKSLQNLPYKIELNEYGKIIRSPVSNKHGFYQAEMSRLLRNQLTQGKTITECSIQTPQGVKVADVAWLSTTFLHQHSLDETPFLAAPEICVEIISPSNSELEMQEKIQLYFQQGAKEVWLVSIEGIIRFFNITGEKPRSAFEVTIDLAF